jgi:shikimate kinase
MNVYFIGMMGSGKTTVAKAAAQRFSVPFIDSDQQIVKKTGVPITTIFELEGEAGFRKRESFCITQIASLSQSHLIATGGGLPTVAANVDAMRQSGKVVYLEVKPEVLWNRLRRDRTRPLLRSENPKQTLFDLLNTRVPLYQACADLQLDVSELTLSQILTKLEPHLLQWLPDLQPCVTSARST